jgi:RNA polymerase sigma factor (sigma-70 family)
MRKMSTSLVTGRAQRIIELEPTLRSISIRAARKHSRFSIDQEDLLQMGRIAVLEADQVFDAEINPSFEGFAIQRAKWAIRNWIKRTGRTIRAPDKKFYKGAVTVISIHAPVGNEADSGTYEDFLGDAETITASAERSDQVQTIARILKRMPSREAAIIRGRFWEDKTLLQIGSELGMTVESVRQNEAKILVQLRRSRRLLGMRNEAA